jgi:Pvc16 N-terminal domain
MSNSLAIGAVTSTIRYVLDRALQQPHAGQVGGAGVTTLRPTELAAVDVEESPGINVYCYQATPNHAWNLADLPTRRANGSFVQRPVAALDLHYLVSCVGVEPQLVPQRLLGRVVVALAATSVLTRDVVDAALDAYGAEPDTSFIVDSDLASEVELVKLSPTPLSLEEMSKLWGILDTPYVLSLSYLATVVLIAADVTPRVALPVRRRELTVTPAGPPRIHELETDPPRQPVGPGTTLVLRGSRLLGPVTRVRIGRAALTPADGAGNAELRVAIDDTVAAGVHSLQVAHTTAPGPGGLPPARRVAGSNAVPLLVRPEVEVTDVSADEVTLSVAPPLQEGQRASVVLGRLDGAEEPSEVTLVLPPVAEDDAPLAELVLPRADIPDGHWLVRLQVDGVESLPQLAGDVYGEPDLTLS